MNKEQKGNIIIYQSGDGISKIDVRLEDETVWLSQLQLVELFDSSKSNVSEHITKIYNEGELEKEATVRNFRTVQKEGSGLKRLKPCLPAGGRQAGKNHPGSSVLIRG